MFLLHKAYRGELPALPQFVVPGKGLRNHCRWSAVGTILPIPPVFQDQVDALPLPLQGVFPFQLIQRGKHGQHKLPGRRGGVDAFLQRDQVHLFPLQVFHKIEEITCVPGQEGVEALSNTYQQLMDKKLEDEPEDKT